MCTFLSFGMLAELFWLLQYWLSSSNRCTQPGHPPGCEERWSGSAGKQTRRPQAWREASWWCWQSLGFSKRSGKHHSLHPEHVHLIIIEQVFTVWINVYSIYRYHLCHPVEGQPTPASLSLEDTAADSSCFARSFLQFHRFQLRSSS